MCTERLTASSGKRAHFLFLASFTKIQSKAEMTVTFLQRAQNLRNGCPGHPLE